MADGQARLYVDRRSSSSLRVLSYLACKKIELEIVEVDIVAGEHRKPEFRSVFTAGCVPVLEVGGRGRFLSQSGAILAYLETLHPAPSMLPADAFDLAAMQEICSFVSSDLHAITSLRIRRRVSCKWGEAEGKDWTSHWTENGLATLDALLAHNAGAYAIGDSLTLADFFVWPALRNAGKFGISIAYMKNLSRLAQGYSRLDCFASLA